MDKIRIIFRWIFFIAIVGVFSGCKKADYGSFTNDHIIGVWKLEEKFNDIDSNGYSSNDYHYKTLTKDSNFWVFRSDEFVEYHFNNNSLLAHWTLTYKNKVQPYQLLHLNSDPDAGEHSYRIQTLDNNNLIIYNRLIIIRFGVPSYEWWGYKLSK